MSSLAEDTPAPSKGPSIVALIAVVVVLTFIAAAGGWFLGTQLGLAVPGADAATADSNKKPPAEADSHGQCGAAQADPHQCENSAGRLDQAGSRGCRASWRKISDELAATVAGDFMAFLRTVNLMQLRGPAGLEYLRMDLQGKGAKCARKARSSKCISGRW